MTDVPWRWVDERVVRAIQAAQIAEHGGAAGERDPASLRAALDHPCRLAELGRPDLANLAAAYAHGIAGARGFVDGNLRTGFVVACVFLLDHGQEVTADDREVARIMMSVAAGATGESDLAAWFRQNLRPVATR